jgi:hypothetical protein
MQTVNFNCPHCGNLMAVGTNLLGRNVRCPHCKQVVRAPAAPGEPLVQNPAPPVSTPAPPPTPKFDLPQTVEHHESIFGERHDEDVFGSEPPKPTLPPVPAPPPLPAPAPQMETVTAPPVSAPEPEYVSPTATTLDFSAPADGALEDRTAERGVPEPGRVDTVFQSRKAREEPGTTPAFAWILLAYAAVVTIAAGFFGYQYFTAGSKEEHPYKAMPDVIREYKPAEKRQMSFNGMPDPKLEIPKELRVKLGEELTVGDLKVQPLYVEKKDVDGVTKYVSADDKKRNLQSTLVLTLRVRNLSSDTVFIPNDPAFNRALDAKQPTPYTGLQFYRDYFFGTFKWPPDAGTEKEYIEGQEADEQPLKPGEERDTWVHAASPKARTAGAQDWLSAIGDTSKQNADLLLIWHVQLRRGIVKMKNEAGQEVDVSATTVIGVEFKPREIKGL